MNFWSHGFGEGMDGSSTCARCGRDQLTCYVLKNNETICKRCWGPGSNKFLTMEGSWNSAMRRDQFDVREESFDEAKTKFVQSNNRAMIKKFGDTRFKRPRYEVING